MNDEFIITVEWLEPLFSFYIDILFRRLGGLYCKKWLSVMG